MHFCHEELFALMMLIPGITALVSRLRVWWHKKHECHHEEETSVKVEAEQ